jgi:hypothetical protein
MTKVFLAVLFITMTAFIINGTTTNNSPNDIQGSINNVKEYQAQSEQLFEQGFTTLINTADALVTSINGFTSFLVGLVDGSRLFNPFNPTQQQIEDTINVICTPYEQLNVFQQSVYQTRLWLYNLFNSPNLTIEQFYVLDRGLEFGIDWNQVCS